MKIQHFKADNSKTITWASGTSTELFIYPPTGDFQKRDFLFRLSTATVEAEESVFSDFSGITRTLMLLKGNLTLIHEGRYTKELKPFDQDTFDGGWDTKSKGKVKDFNLMCKAGAEGTVTFYEVQNQETKSIELKGYNDFIYCENGSFKIGELHVYPGDIILIVKEEEKKIELCGIEKCDVIHVSININ
jgi:environmental stress-induced protein Ves